LVDHLQWAHRSSFFARALLDGQRERERIAEHAVAVLDQISFYLAERTTDTGTQPVQVLVGPGGGTLTSVGTVTPAGKCTRGCRARRRRFLLPDKRGRIQRI